MAHSGSAQRIITKPDPKKNKFLSWKQKKNLRSSGLNNWKCPPSARVLCSVAKSTLHPWFITGFSDGEGCFYIGVRQNNSCSTGWEVGLTFIIGLDRKDRALLEYIQLLLGVGNITKQGKDMIQYRVSSVKDLQVIIDHFDKYPLITQKLADYLLFKRPFELVKRKEHITTKGLNQIVAIKASMNNGLSEKLKAAFPNTIPVPRPLIMNQKIQDPNWLAGFTSGEGCFFINIKKGKTKTGFIVTLKFRITQSSRDSELMKSLVTFFGCGRIESDSRNSTVDFVVTRFSDITDNVIIPFFNKYNIIGKKEDDFNDWCEVPKIMVEKGHLRVEGLEEIRLIKARMNRGRSRST